MLFATKKDIAHDFKSRSLKNHSCAFPNLATHVYKTNRIIFSGKAEPSAKFAVLFSKDSDWKRKKKLKNVSKFKSIYCFLTRIGYSHFTKKYFPWFCLSFHLKIAFGRWSEKEHYIMRLDEKNILSLLDMALRITRKECAKAIEILEQNGWK